MRKKRSGRIFTGGLALWGGLALALAGALLPAGEACAETYHGGSDWTVAFTAEAKMESSFGMQDLDDVITGLQPGDDAVITLNLRNDSGNSTYWYMTNEVLYSLEDRSANKATYGGAYTYVLTYTDGQGRENVLFSSDTVGGEAQTQGSPEGLHEATEALEDYFYLDTLDPGEGGVITLEVALDGETQGNDYQDTRADLQMNFAVELVRTTSTGTPSPSNPDVPAPSASVTTVTSHIRPVKTGDDGVPMPLLITLFCGGVLFMGLAAFSLRRSRKEGEER